MAAKRLHNGFDHDGDQPDDKRMRRLPSFSTVIREAMMQKHMQNLFRLLEPLLRRVVSSSSVPIRHFLDDPVVLVLICSASRGRSGAGGAPGGADAEPALHRAVAAADPARRAAGVEAGVPYPAAAADLHGQQDRGRQQRASGDRPRGRGHRRTGRRGPAGAARRAGPAVRRLPARRPRGLDPRGIPEGGGEGARGQAPAPHRRGRPHHEGGPRHGGRAPVHGQLLLGPLPQVPHRRPRGARQLRRRQDPRGHDRGLHGQGPPRRALPQALPSRPRRRGLEAREDRQGRRVPPEAQANQRRHRPGVRQDAHGEARRAARDSGRGHDRPDVGGDDEPRQDLRRPRRQGVRVRHTARHHLRELRLQAREGRDRRRRVAAAAAEGPCDDCAAADAGGVRAPPQPPGGRSLHDPWPRRQQRPSAAECSTAGACRYTDLVPEHPGDRVPGRRDGFSHSPSQQQLRLPVAWPSVPHARLRSALGKAPNKFISK